MGCLNLDSDRDHYRLVYLTFFFLGMTMLFAFNSFVSAPAFMMNYYKYCSNQDAKSSMPNVWKNIESYISVANMVPNLLCQIVVISDFGRRFSQQSRIVVSMVVIILSMAMIPIMTYADMPEAASLTVLLAGVVISAAATAVYQATAFGLAASFPPIYTGAMLFGIGMSGSISCLARIVTKASMSESYEHTLLESRIYFAFACSLMIISILLVFLLKHNPFAIRYVSEYREAEDAPDFFSGLLLSPETKSKVIEQRSPLCLDANQKFDDIPDPSVKEVLWKIRWLMFSCFYVFFITLVVFPGVGVAVNPTDAWFGVIIIAMFNFGDTIGRFGSNLQFLWIPRKALPFIAVARTVFIPLFIICIDPKLIKGNIVPYIIMGAVGMTNGLPGSLAMIYGGQAEELETEKERQVAGNAMSLSLLSGCSLGSLVALLITSQNWL